MKILTILLLTLSAIFPSKQCLSQTETPPIKNVVILVLENRSFDHLIGWMKKSINPSIDGIDGTECNPVNTQDPKSKSICVSDDAEYVDPDPGHSFEDVAKQVFGGNINNTIPSMKGFIEQALSMSGNVSEAVMRGFKPQNVPVFAALVKEFAIFDRWFSSIPGPTQPNRLFVYSGTSHGAVSHVKKQLALGYPQKTIFDSLHENDLDFGVYYQSIPSTLFYRNMRKLKYVLKFHFYDTFKKHANDGKLPSLSVIEPRYFDVKGTPANDDHPSHDVANGQKLVKEVYETLRASPQWNSSLLLITYDEHGGFYDHVQTPYINVPSPDGNTGPAPTFFKFDRLGVRVPTIMVSPWINKGT
ncbi:Non-specific phospholipase C6, partial [Bienertia sinuspersici]